MCWIEGDVTRNRRKGEEEGGGAMLNVAKSRSILCPSEQRRKGGEEEA